ncbi:hypothetical protein MARI_08910 [Marinobacter sp. JH2]|uniref:DUF924 family protein n=1 Tax=Marinobacter sp. AL4B TaxID=2871173 RepID=UPI001056A98B|nr:MULTISPECIES: DUF924 family protein [unclassified Marinobacter]MBZ0332769.1 DUF924 domain-containing protein [Marinobacter sp. AL4B]QBM16796.1 hypothetical protein MARI_08910 [Marinobacter sp. JH2]
MFDWKELLDFWFGELDDQGLPDKFHRNRWFRSDRPFDREIRRRFMSLVVFASEQGLENWRTEAGGALAEILLLDQFTRNIYRGTSLAFEHDRLARERCRSAMNKGFDVALPSVMRAFVYMPLQHSELRDDQELSVQCYRQLAATERGLLGDFLENFVQSAEDHREVVEKFGRFPHRNKVLGRVSTEEEGIYLKSGSRYGQ